MSDKLRLIEKHPHIWRAATGAQDSAGRLPTGYADLDKALNGGVPAHGLVRVRACLGIGEVSAFLPVFRQCPAHQFTVFVNPPGAVHAPWLLTQGFCLEQVYVVTPETWDDALWATEQCIKNDACQMVLCWLDHITPKQARRLQVAAAQHQCLCLLYESVSVARQALPVVLDLALQPVHNGLNVEIHKQRGGWAHDGIVIPLTHLPSNDAIARAMLQYGHNTTDRVGIV